MTAASILEARLPATKSLGNWYGSNRSNTAAEVGAELEGCSWVGVTFAGGMSELLYMTARTLGVNDRHRHLINMVTMLATPRRGPELVRHLRRQPFTTDLLDNAQRLCRQMETRVSTDVPVPSLFGLSDERLAKSELTEAERWLWAGAYWITSWMGRGGNAGTPKEFKGKLPLRWDADGGGSSVRYFSAVESIPAWRRRVLRRCEFTTLDFEEFLASVKDQPGVGVYCDPPFPGPGDQYTHQLGPKGQQRLATAVSRFKHARVVMRFYDVPLVRELYPMGPWIYREFAGRDQHNNAAKKELLIINGPSYVAAVAA